MNIQNIIKKIFDATLLHKRLYTFSLMAVIDIIVTVSISFAEPLLVFVRRTSVQCLLSPLGLKCGVCGGTHCIECLMVGDIHTALRSNLIIPFLFLFLIILFITANLAFIFNITQAKIVLFKHLLRLHNFIFFGMVFILYMVVRNIISI